MAPYCSTTEIPGGIAGAHHGGTSVPQVGALGLMAIYFSRRADTNRQTARSVSPGLRQEAFNCLAAEDDEIRLP